MRAERIMAPPAVLVVEDEETLARAITYSLEREGYTALSAKDGSEGLALAKQRAPDLVILDLMLPKVDGYEVCRTLRRETTIPILMLTAKAEEVDKIVGLELGADDYMTKPFSMRELLARVKALLRRVDLDLRAAKAAPGAETLRSNGLSLDASTRQVKLNEKLVALRPKEFDLLAFLMRNKSIVFTRESLLERVWGYEYAGDSRTVDVHIRWLREKIEEAPSEPKRLLTIRGVGYKFEG
jgi:two-component system OmpR family response regulator